MQYMRKHTLRASSALSALIIGIFLAYAASAGTFIFLVGGPNASARPLPELEVTFRNRIWPGTVSAERVSAHGEAMPFWDFGAAPMTYDIDVTLAYEDGIVMCATYYSPFVQDRYQLSRQRLMIAGKGANGLWHILPRASVLDSHLICGKSARVMDVAVVQPFGLAPLVVRREDADEPGPEAAAVSVSAEANPHTRRISFFSKEGEATLIIENDPARPVTGARMALNGKTVMRGDAFKRHILAARAPVTLLAGENILEVAIDGGPASSLTVSICGLSPCAE